MMDEKLFDSLEFPCQNLYEWPWFLRFCEMYFRLKGVEHPLVVELGVDKSQQRPYYEQLLGAEYVGVDIAPKRPDEVAVVGDSQKPETVDKLKKVIGGRPVDILFIDGDHSYEAVKRDYELFAPLVRHLVCFHDCSVLPSIRKLWDELLWDNVEKNGKKLFIKFANNPGKWEPPIIHCGIGVIVLNP